MLVLSQPNGSGGCECPCKCHDLFGDTLEAVVAGITECLICYENSGSGRGFIAQFAGINTGHSVPYIGGDTWSKDIGIVNITVWNNGDGTCTGDPVGIETSSAKISISCDPVTNLFLVNIIVPAFGSSAGFMTIFGGGGVLNALMPNTVTFADCGISAVIGYDGAMVISNP